MELLTVFGQPLHQRINHIPVGIWVLSFVWDLVAAATGSELWWILSFWTLLAGVAAAIPVSAVGLYDFLQIPRENPGKAVAIYHVLAIGAASACFVASLVARWPTLGFAPPVGSVLTLSGTGVLFLAFGTWLGGELILLYGIGRRERVPYPGPERRRHLREPALHG